MTSGDRMVVRERTGIRGRCVAVRCTYPGCSQWFEAKTVPKACDLLEAHGAAHPQPDPKEVLKALSPSFGLKRSWRRRS